MSATTAGWLLVAIAALLLLAGCPQAALLLSLGAGMCALLSGPSERADARRRNPSRYQAHREVGR